MHYNQEKKKKKGEYDILKEITTNVTLVQLMDSLGNVNHAISVVVSWRRVYTSKVMTNSTNRMLKFENVMNTITY